MDRENIGRKLRELRAGIRRPRGAYGLTQQELSDRVGLKQSTYAMYESGKRLPSDENKIKLAKFYGMTVQELFYT